MKTMTIYVMASSPAAVPSVAQWVIAGGFASARAFGMEVWPEVQDWERAKQFGLGEPQPTTTPDEFAVAITAPDDLMDEYQKALSQVE